MSPRFIDRFDVILLDMARTFMFNVDRFSEEEDFAATYRALGGTALSDSYVQRIIRQLFFALWADYQNPQSQDCFPSVHSYLHALPDTALVPQSERGLLEHVFARHEMGNMPAAYVDALRQLHATHHLGVVSDIWSASRFFLQAFNQRDIRSLFDVIIFSSDHGCVKPSPRLFRQALGRSVLTVARLCSWAIAGSGMLPERRQRGCQRFGSMRKTSLRQIASCERI
jgi:FMN phosphatase YigB (HAD superfamily)